MAHAEAGTLASLRPEPVRVLLVGNDRRFLRVAGALLAAEGHVVYSTERSSDLLELVHRLDTDVAVIDASRSLTHAARAATSLRGLPVPVATVLVAERNGSSAVPGMALVYKWSGFEELCSRVEAAYVWRRAASA
jgi:CheY-like chemotaxis protein